LTTSEEGYKLTASMNVQEWWRYTAREYIKKYLKLVGFRGIYEITFWLTHRCVYNCKFCLMDENSGPFLPKEAIFAIMEEALRYKLGTVPITGGEPMLHPDFVEICRYIGKRVPNVGIHVTGRLVDESVLYELERVRGGWTWWLTIIARDPELNDRFRSPGALEDVIRASALLRQRGHIVNIAINVVPESLGVLEDTVRFAFEELKGCVVSTEPIAAMGRAVKNADISLLNDEQLHSYYSLMTDLIPRYREKGRSLDALNVFYGFPKRCAFLWCLYGMNVHPEGHINPCCYFTDVEGSIGHIEEGIMKCTSLPRCRVFEKRMDATFSNVEERVKAVGIWSCFECVLNYQIHNKGRKDLMR